MSLINCEIDLILNWSTICVISPRTASKQARKFALTDAKLNVPVVALSTDDNAKLKLGFKRKVKYQNQI